MGLPIMSGVYPIVFFVAVVLVWFATVIQGAKLLKAFVTKYPQESQREIPYASSRMRHPEKVFFFFRRKSLPLLKGDPMLWKLRQQLKLLLLLSAVLPVLLFAFLVLSAFAERR